MRFFIILSFTIPYNDQKENAMKNLSKAQKILLEENSNIHETFMLHILLLTVSSLFVISLNSDYISIPQGNLNIAIYVLCVLVLYTICFLIVLKIVKEHLTKQNIKKHILKNDFILEECNIISYDISNPVLYLTVQTATQTLKIKCGYSENAKYIYTNEPCHIYIVGQNLLYKLVR